MNSASVKAEIKRLGLKVSPVEFIINEVRRSHRDMPKADKVSAARAICDLYGLSINPEILVSAAWG